MKILAIYDSSGPKYHRILMPVAMMELHHDIEVLVRNKVEEKDLPGVDIILFNRIFAGLPLDKVLQLQKTYGFKLVCDMDDHWILDSSHYLYYTYAANGTSEKIRSFIAASDAVTVTHERLYDEVKPVNPNCYILPNSIAKYGQFLVKKVPDPLTRLFWAGGITHRHDLELLRRPLSLIKRDKVKAIIAGYEENNAEWTAMAKIFTTDSAYNTMVIKSEKVHAYYNAYALCDISLIPLVNNSFNIHKSNLKILEAANIGSPVIVSRVHPYLDFPEELVNYVDMHNPWYKQIQTMVNDEILRNEQGAALKEYCDIHYNFDKINEERYQIFERYGKANTGNTLTERQVSEQAEY